eukprot:g4804.t1
MSLIMQNSPNKAPGQVQMAQPVQGGAPNHGPVVMAQPAQPMGGQPMGQPMGGQPMGQPMMMQPGRQQMMGGQQMMMQPAGQMMMNPSMLGGQNMGTVPRTGTCPHCKAHITTGISFQVSAGTHALACGCCLCGLWLGCRDKTEYERTFTNTLDCQIKELDSSVVVCHVEKNGVAYNAGVRVGDVLLSVAGISTHPGTLQKTKELLIKHGIPIRIRFRLPTPKGLESLSQCDSSKNKIDLRSIPNNQPKKSKQQRIEDGDEDQIELIPGGGLKTIHYDGTISFETEELTVQLDPDSSILITRLDGVDLQIFPDMTTLIMYPETGITNANARFDRNSIAGGEDFKLVQFTVFSDGKYCMKWPDGMEVQKYLDGHIIVRQSWESDASAGNDTVFGKEYLNTLWWKRLERFAKHTFYAVSSLKEKKREKIAPFLAFTKKMDESILGELEGVLKKCRGYFERSCVIRTGVASHLQALEEGEEKETVMERKESVPRKSKGEMVEEILLNSARKKWERISKKWHLCHAVVAKFGMASIDENAKGRNSFDEEKAMEAVKELEIMEAKMKEAEKTLKRREEEKKKRERKSQMTKLNTIVKSEASIETKRMNMKRSSPNDQSLPKPTINTHPTKDARTLATSMKETPTRIKEMPLENAPARTLATSIEETPTRIKERPPEIALNVHEGKPGLKPPGHHRPLGRASQTAAMMAMTKEKETSPSLFYFQKSIGKVEEEKEIVQDQNEENGNVEEKKENVQDQKQEKKKVTYKSPFMPDFSIISAMDEEIIRKAEEKLRELKYQEKHQNVFQRLAVKSKSPIQTDEKSETEREIVEDEEKIDGREYTYMNQRPDRYGTFTFPKKYKIEQRSNRRQRKQDKINEVGMNLEFGDEILRKNLILMDTIDEEMKMRRLQRSVKQGRKHQKVFAKFLEEKKRDRARLRALDKRVRKEGQVIEKLMKGKATYKELQKVLESIGVEKMEVRGVDLLKVVESATKKAIV